MGLSPTKPFVNNPQTHHCADMQPANTARTTACHALSSPMRTIWAKTSWTWTASQLPTQSASTAPPLRTKEASSTSTLISTGRCEVGTESGFARGIAARSVNVPLRPHIGTLGVMPANSDNYLAGNNGAEGANTIPPSQFGGNIDDWRVGKGALVIIMCGGTMYYKVEVAGAKLFAGDTHAAQGDSELAGTAMETSMTAKLKVTLHKAASLPKVVSNLTFPLLETSEEYVVHGFAYSNYLDQLAMPSDIFAEGASLDMAMEDCFNKTRLFLMNGWDLTEEETIAMMSTGVDFGITQVVDGNWGVHADIEKWMFEPSGSYTPYDYSCTNPARRRRRSLLMRDERRQMLESAGIFAEPEDAALVLWDKVTSAVGCAACNSAPERQKIADKMLDAKF
eukprot:scaffold100793_cov30-Prasinocladus_malaysianus.AAC.1